MCIIHINDSSNVHLGQGQTTTLDFFSKANYIQSIGYFPISIVFKILLGYLSQQIFHIITPLYCCILTFDTQTFFVAFILLLRIIWSVLFGGVTYLFNKMAKLVGKWKIQSSDNFDAYMKALGKCHTLLQYSVCCFNTLSKTCLLNFKIS